MTTATTRTDLRRGLHKFLESLPLDGYLMGEMRRVRFGIIDPDRANWLGLSFDVEIFTKGTALLYLPEAESLDLLRRFGSAENLESKRCWVYLSGPGCSPTYFVCLDEDAWKPVEEETRP